MKATDLDLRELLSFEPKGGVIRFGGERAILLDAVALGLLRKELIETLGSTAARGILTRFGYAHGWRTAENLHTAFPWDSELEWRLAGGRLHMLQGMVALDMPVRRESHGPPVVQKVWRDSYEAEQHLLHLGPAEEPVCWTLAGFASGYLSFCEGREVYCLEDRCRGKGDAECHLLARAKDDWGPEIEPHLPFYRKESLDATLESLTEALHHTEKRLRAHQEEIARLTGLADDPLGLVGRSEAMARVLALARRIARVESAVIVTGESGVGKERVAQLIHDESSRAGRPFVAVNCGAITESLLESELFGHAKGAFTGADKERPGLFEAASGGTLFLDEIGELSLGMQVKLLRALQEKAVRRVGENRSRPVDIRVITATNRELAAEVEGGRFREDLYYRLRVIELRIPPLRERPEDILALARLFLSEISRQMGREVTSFTPRAADQLLRCEWRGNVRELRNAVEYAVALCNGNRIDLEDLPEYLRGALPKPAVFGPIRQLKEIERDYILSAIEASGGNKSRAAAALGLGACTLFRKLKEYESEGSQGSRGRARR
ncbi:MAG: sigma-54-dependent Fis family transcriptional regulator [Deltaproteobacteria bacterium]|nr:sigma-54-dependent Fis family transcriptional regulator [Deltaproteobacteria bacterium]